MSDDRDIQAEKQLVEYLSGRSAAEIDHALMRLRMLAVPSDDPPPATERLVDRAVSLASLVREGVPAVEYLPGPLANQVVYRTGTTCLSGHPGSGKTTVAQRLALDYMEAGGDVIYLDWEAGEADAASRLIALGASPELLDARMHYLGWPDLSWEEADELWEAWPGALGLWDSMKGALNGLNLDEDRATDVVKFTTPLNKLTKRHDVAQLVIDHTTKADDGKGKYTQRGSGVKLADVEGLWYVEAVREFSQTEAGEIHMTRKRQRKGGLRNVVRLAVGDGEGGLPIRELDHTEATTAASRIRRDVREFLRAHSPDRFPRSRVRQEVRGENTQIDAALADLAGDAAETVHVARDESARAIERYWYDETEQSGTSSITF